MMRLSYHARVFLAGLVAVVLLGTAGWLGWYYYDNPLQTLANGMTFRAPRNWKTIDVSILSEDVRPVIVYTDPKEKKNRFTIVKQQATTITLDQLAQQIGANVKAREKSATVDKKIYLGAKSTRPFVLAHGPSGDETAATVIKSGTELYLVEADFPRAKEGTFGKTALAIMKSIRLK